MLLRRAFSTASSRAGHDVLHQSRIPTLHFQQSLPKLPVPKLEDTMRRMLYAAEPISTAAELEEARALADDFASGIGRELHEALVQRDKSRYSRSAHLHALTHQMKARALLAPPIHARPPPAQLHLGTMVRALPS